MRKPVDHKRKKQAQRWGQWAEAFVRLYLRLHGYRILASNAKTPVGEIDIIAKRGKWVVFVEVKARPTYPTAAEAVSKSQQRRITRAAGYFLNQHPDLQSNPYRFDVALVLGKFRLKIIQNAWQDGLS